MEPRTDGLYHHALFSNLSRLVEIKEEKGLKISLAFPTLNEESTIGAEVELMRQSLMDRRPLLDEIAVIDSGSDDWTREVATGAGAQVYLASDILPEIGQGSGKGENLWKSLMVLEGDIIVWLDADIENLHPKFVYGLVGPLLCRDDLMFVKAFYERPLAVGKELLGTGGGRVTEILVRPLFACFYPELACIFQPCAGEYAGRRAMLEQLPFSMGYGVESGLLIDIYEKHGMDVIAQVNLDKRIHRNQPVERLGKMSFEIIHAFFTRLKEGGKLNGSADIERQFFRTCLDTKGLVCQKEGVQINERPPIINLPQYNHHSQTVI